MLLLHHLLLLLLDLLLLQLLHKKHLLLFGHTLSVVGIVLNSTSSFAGFGLLSRSGDFGLVGRVLVLVLDQGTIGTLHNILRCRHLLLLMLVESLIVLSPA